MSDATGEKRRKKSQKDKKEHTQKKTRRTSIDGDAPAPSLGLKLTFKFGKSIKSVTHDSATIHDPAHAVGDTPPRKRERGRGRGSDEDWSPPEDDLGAESEPEPVDKSDNSDDSDGSDTEPSAKPRTARQAMQAEVGARQEREPTDKAAPKIKFAPMRSTAKDELARRHTLGSEQREQQQQQGTAQKRLQKQTKLRKKDSAARKEDKNKVDEEVRPTNIQHFANATGFYVNLPVGVTFPLVAPAPRPQHPRPPPRCSIDGCSEAKRYADSTTGRPLCSLKCFKLLRASTPAAAAATATAV